MDDKKTIFEESVESFLFEIGDKAEYAFVTTEILII